MLTLKPRKCHEIGNILIKWAKLIERHAPEYKLPPSIEEGSREHTCFLFFTANIDQAMTLRRIRPVVLDRNRVLFGAEALWFYSRRLVELNPYAFSPEVIVRFSNNLTYVLMCVYPGLGVPDKCARYWVSNARILLRRYNGDPRRIAEKCGYDALRVLRELKIFHGVGDKLSNFIFRFMYKMGFWSDVRNAHEVNIPADIHLQKLAFRTGMIESSKGPVVLGRSDVIRRVEEAYREAAKGCNVLPLDLDEPAWHIGRLCCSRKYGEFSCYTCPEEKRRRCSLASYCPGRCPLSDVCEKRIDLILVHSWGIVDSRPKYKPEISELEDLYPAVQRWLEREHYGSWLADWPINHEKLDYIAYHETLDRLVAVEGIVDDKRNTLRHLGKLRYAAKVADEAYVATNSPIVEQYVKDLGLGILKYSHDEQEIVEVKRPTVRGSRDLNEWVKIHYSFRIVQSYLHYTP